ncbi:MAG: ShlB/FhaC/HecB family hemolysin secretion/activation protein [Gammaproteobacteria bacterium]
MLGAAAAAHAQDGAPAIREIEFRGNDTTEPATMLREMSLRVGDPADRSEVERSRQGVQDLGLFRSVHAELEPVEGGVRLVIKVKEKLYVLPLPRADANSDGGYGYGVELRWYNVWGLNHTFTPYFERRQPSEGANDPETRGLQTRTQLRYSAPFLLGEFGVDATASYFETPYLTPLEYEQTNTALAVALTRKLSEGLRNQGWTGRAGLSWTREVQTGPQVPTAPDEVARGRALAALVGAAYRDLHYNVYSDQGVSFGFGVQSAAEDISSDYDFTSWSLYYARYTYLGDSPHQNLNFLFNAQGRHDGAYGGDSLAIGGTSTVRGYEPETAKGDAFYAASVEYLRPVFRNSIRLLAVVDAGNAFAEPADANLDKVYVSAGIGLRVRFQAFVALDLEIGMAWPLNGGPPRLFATKV